MMCLAAGRWYTFEEISSYDKNGEPEWVYLADEDGEDYLFHVDSIEAVEEYQ